MTISVRAPYGHEIVAEVPSHTAEDVDRAVLKAARALREQPLPQWRRAEILDRAAVLLAERQEEFARTIALEAAKPIRSARDEARRAASTFRFAAAEARKLAGDVIPLDAVPSGEGRIGFTLRVPIGVVGAIAPFNFPLNLVAHKLAPAIAAGCPVVLKPASQTPLSSIALADLLVKECGLPEDYLTVVVGSGSTVGNALVDHSQVALLTFTGLPDVGWAIRARAPRKRVGLELGNNSPVIIEPDGDWERAAEKIRTAGFSHAGQSCISTQRIYVHSSIAHDFTDALAAGVETLVVGDPLDEATEVSALISESETDRVSSWTAEALDAGAKLVTGGLRRSDGTLAPTVLSDVTAGLKVSDCEVFGPVVGLTSYDDFDAALGLANSTRFGLQAAVFTQDITKALRAVKSLDFGGVLVNEVPTWRADQQPYGGLRDSGNTREGPAYAVREMTESRLVVLSL